MPAQQTRADALREYLSGASFDGGQQCNPAASLGGYRSSTEAVSLGMTIANAIQNVTVLYASGANGVGTGTLTALDGATLAWSPPGGSAGQPVPFLAEVGTLIVEGPNSPGQYLRILGEPPFTPGQASITLACLQTNVFGFDVVTIAEATAGFTEYRATILRNESSVPLLALSRMLATLGMPQVSNVGVLGASGSGTITTGGSFSSWPKAGWCQILQTSGAIREIVYYTSRTSTVLTVPSAGRGLFTTSATAGGLTDAIVPVPGIGIGFDPAGVQASGSSIQTIANAQTPPTSVSWTFGVSSANGLQLPELAPSQQIGVWMWRYCPPGVVATPAALNQMYTNFNINN